MSFVGLKTSSLNFLRLSPFRTERKALCQEIHFCHLCVFLCNAVTQFFCQSSRFPHIRSDITPSFAQTDWKWSNDWDFLTALMKHRCIVKKMYDRRGVTELKRKSYNWRIVKKNLKVNMDLKYVVMKIVWHLAFCTII